VQGGVFQEEGISALLLAPGNLPNNSGTRCGPIILNCTMFSANLASCLALLAYPLGVGSSLRRHDFWVCLITAPPVHACSDGGVWPCAWVGVRNLKDNLSDLRAQVAANKQGEVLMHELIREYGIGVVQAYMNHIQANAEQAVRAMLVTFSKRQKLAEVRRRTIDRSAVIYAAPGHFRPPRPGWHGYIRRTLCGTRPFLTPGLWP
jgi:hypothetical protein